MAKMDLRKSVGVRLVIVVVMTLVLQIPALMIMSLISERETRRNTAAEEISMNWGTKQVLVGPFLTIPVKYQGYNQQNEIVNRISYARFLPKTLDIKGALFPDSRKRGIYEIVVYNSDIEIAASFDSPDFDDLNTKIENVMWEEATVTLGISDMKGVKDIVSIQWNDTLLEGNPGVPGSDLITSGITIPVEFDSDETEYKFQTKLNLNGSSELLFAPTGKQTTLQLSSSWNNPSFSGDYLPSNHEINADGFTANWSVLHVSRTYPQKWVGAQYKIDESLFGVNLLLPIDQYQMTTRTVKYAIMFIALTFLTFFVIEILSGKPIHPIQYLLVGLALLVFFTLLLSLSEYITFGLAYLIASAAVIAMITFYSTSFLSDRFRSAIVAMVLMILYGYLYIVLQLQDYSLLMGSVILFVALGLMMYLTRRIDWFAVLNYQRVNETESKQN
ncbi:MAG: cell envelope integrity protein CreD [bacterium]|nr:cell envelope integrity protein CreD [bacterium]